MSVFHLWNCIIFITHPHAINHFSQDGGRSARSFWWNFVILLNFNAWLVNFSFGYCIKTQVEWSDDISTMYTDYSSMVLLPDTLVLWHTINIVALHFIERTWGCLKQRLCWHNCTAKQCCPASCVSYAKVICIFPNKRVTVQKWMISSQSYKIHKISFTKYIKILCFPKQIWQKYPTDVLLGDEKGSVSHHFNQNNGSYFTLHPDWFST